MHIKDTTVWTCMDGRRIRVCDMHDKHLLNTLNMMRRNFEHNEEVLGHNKKKLEETLHGKDVLLEMVMEKEHNDAQLFVKGWVERFESEAKRRGLEL